MGCHPMIAKMPVRHTFHDMRNDLTDAVREAIAMVPGSVNGLAEAANLWQSDLSRILSGDRQASETVAERLEAALIQWAENCATAADIIHKARSQKQEVD